jgi:hypothetical protein
MTIAPFFQDMLKGLRSLEDLMKSTATTPQVRLSWRPFSAYPPEVRMAVLLGAHDLVLTRYAP